MLTAKECKAKTKSKGTQLQDNAEKEKTEDYMMNICPRQRFLLGLALTTSLVTMTIVTIYIQRQEADSKLRNVLKVNTSTTCKDLRAGKNHTTAFPRVVHQTWKSSSIPSKWLSHKRACMDLNPGYNFTLWSDADLEKFIAAKYPWFLSTYKSYPYHIERVDAARYFILHYYGGVYIDLDIRCKVPFDEIITKTPTDRNTILGGTLPVGITNSMMISKPNDPFMSFVISRLRSVQGWYVFPYFTIMLSTGPMMVWRTYNNYPCKENVLVLTPKENTEIYFQHTHGSSWHTWDGPVWTSFDNRFGILSTLVVIAILVGALAHLLKKNLLRFFWRLKSSWIVVKPPPYSDNIK